MAALGRSNPYRANGQRAPSSQQTSSSAMPRPTPVGTAREKKGCLGLITWVINSWGKLEYYMVIARPSIPSDIRTPSFDRRYRNLQAAQSDISGVSSRLSYSPSRCEKRRSRRSSKVSGLKSYKFWSHHESGEEIRCC